MNTYVSELPTQKHHGKQNHLVEPGEAELNRRGGGWRGGMNGVMEKDSVRQTDGLI